MNANVGRLKSGSFSYDDIFGRNQEFARMQVQKARLIGTDYFHISFRLKDARQSSKIIEPELSGAIDLRIRQAGQAIFRGMTLDVTPYMLFDFRERAEQGSMHVAMVFDELFVGEIGFPTKNDGEFDHGVVSVGPMLQASMPPQRATSIPRVALTYQLMSATE